MWQNAGHGVCGRIQDSVCVAEYRIVCVARIQDSVCVAEYRIVCVAEYRIVCVWQNTG